MRWERRREGCEVAFEPTQRGSYDHFVKGFGDVCVPYGCVDGDSWGVGLERIMVKGYGLCGKANVGLCQSGLGDSGEDGAIRVCNKEIF